MRRAAAIVTALAVVLGVAAAAVLWARSRTGAPVAVTWHLGSANVTALPRIAKQAGYFADEGLEVSIDEAPGVQVFDDFLADAGLAFVECSDLLVTERAAGSSDFRVITSTMADDDFFDFVIRGAGVDSLAQLKGKRVGFPPMSATRVFAEQALSDAGLQAGQDYEVVEVAAAEMPDALSAGRIDAHPSYEPITSQSTDALDGDVSVLRAPGVYTLFLLTSTSTRVLQQHPEVAQAALRALIRAEQLVQADPERARQLAATALGVDPSTVSVDQLQLLDVSLGDNVLSGLDVARESLATENRRPESDFFTSATDVIDTAPLDAVDHTRDTIG